MRPLILLELASSLCLLLAGCNTPGLANRAAAEDYTAAVAAEAAAISLAEGSAVTPAAPVNKVPRAQCTVCNGTGKVKSGDGLISFDCVNCYASSGKVVLASAGSPGPAACACGDGCTCAAELAELRRYRDQAEAFFRARGYRSSVITSREKSLPGFDPGQTVVSYGSCASGSCSVSSVGRPVRRGWFVRRQR